MLKKDRDISELPIDKQEEATKLAIVQTTGHIVTANILSKLQIMTKANYVKELEKA